MMELCWNFVF